MEYSQVLDFLYRQLPMYQNQGKKAYKKDLGNTLFLCNQLGHPEKKFKSIHIAGTNGKGSCSHLLASILQEAGYVVGLYTSPHLKDFRERIRINGKEISKRAVIDFVQTHQNSFSEVSPSFFEWTVALAFHHFAEQEVDLAIIETGLGGRLDSTNVIQPELSIITNISYDHMDLLGDSLEKIAWEKAGIIKSKTPALIGNASGQEAIFKRKAQEAKAPLHFASENLEKRYTSALAGDYQKENTNTVLNAIPLLQNQWKIDETAIQKGLQNVVINTKLRGRWEQWSQSPACIADTAHNESGLKQTIQQVLKSAKGEIHFVLGFVKDKNLDQILSLFPAKAKYYFCAADNSRSLGAEELKKKAEQFGMIGHSYTKAKMALHDAKKAAATNDFIYVGGSTFLVAELM